MKILDLSFKAPHENIACDHALLDLCEEGLEDGFLRFWESKEIFVVLGYSNQLKKETNYKNCLKFSIPILRRLSGGGTVLEGPGCLNYTLVLPIKNNLFGQTIIDANHFIMERHRQTLEKLISQPVQIKGSTDLVTENLKFSGNAQRRKSKYLLFHGTFLLNFDFSLIEKFLAMPSKEPDYRKGRSHEDFLINLKISSADIKSALTKIWKVDEELNKAPLKRIKTLVDNIYKTPAWNEKF